MYGYVYLTTNLINNKKYIGQHKSSTFDAWYIGSGIHLTHAVNKYGRENFETVILEECETKEQLNEIKSKIALKNHLNNGNKGQYVGDKNAMYGKMWINNSIENKVIDKNDLNKYIQNG